MAYEVKLDAQISEVLHKDVVFKVKSNGRKLGDLMISKGGVEWRPKGHSVNTIDLKWKQFADKMEN